ncbi:MAG TPA: D-alanyl-D-alanine carboxypeptidase, partial [Pyrinomonadaceae bacterium]|nr:D-alanyl-D-alanine carboxypeptidase [Pyrinomonadaceae bacterium]
MKSKINKMKIVGLLSFAVFCAALNFDTSVTAQETRRERVVEKPTLKQTPNPKPTVAPTVLPTPTPLPTATPTPVPIQTISDLQSRVRLTLARPELRRGSVGVKIVSLDTNKVIFEENAEKYFMPASNMKSYTV